MEHPSFVRKLQPQAMDMFPPWQLRLTEIQSVVSFPAQVQLRLTDIVIMHSFCAPYYLGPGLFGWLSNSMKGESKYLLLEKKVFAAALEEYSKSVAREGK
jgi:hypothetical protein